MAAIPYMNLYVADYLSDTAHLTTTEHGAYLLLLMNYWQRGEALPGDDRKLARITHLSDAEWSDIRPSLVEFFVEQDGKWSHSRVERELASFRTKAEKASNAGKTSAQRRSNSRSTDVEQTFNHTDTDTDSDKHRDIPEAAQHGSTRDAAPRLDQNSLEWKLRNAANWWHDAPKLSIVQPIQDLLDQGYDLDLDVLPVIRAYASQAGSRTSWKYFIGPIMDARKERLKVVPMPTKAAAASQDATVSSTKVYVSYGTEQGDAWETHYRTELHRTPPRDSRGGWYFASAWPPGHPQFEKISPPTNTQHPTLGESEGEGRRPTEGTADAAGEGSTTNASVVEGDHTVKSAEPPHFHPTELPDVPEFLRRKKGAVA